MDLSFVVLNYQTAGLVRNLVKNILNLKLDYSFEILVGDNASKDGIAKIMKEHFSELDNVNFFEYDENNGYGAGNNKIIKNAKGKYIVILNPDIVVLNGTIEKLYNYLESHSDVGIVSPKLLYANKKVQQSYFAYYHLMTPLYRRTFLGKTKKGQTDLDRFLMKGVDINGATTVDWLMGSFWMMRKHIFDELSGFDDQYFMYFEDSDLCRRVNEAGHKVMYHPEAEAIHLHARDSKSKNFWSSILNKMTWIHLSSAYKYFRKFGIKSKK